MNKSAIKNFAVNARKKLIEQVVQKAFQIGITAKSITELKQEAGHIILNNIPQEKGFKLQRDKLIEEIEQKGYDQVMEEVAYTWFNHFIALRFMELNDYLPTGVRVLSSLDPNKAEPDILREALNVDLVIDRTMIYNFQDRNDSEGLFKYLLIQQCNDLNKILPFMFETISDYTELLFPSNLLQKGSVIRDLVTSIPEEDWKEVEIIGWLYQYYISEKKDEVFADLKKNKKITKENIPAATQLFTPKWIVQYMVENSLGRLWLESHPNDELKAQWKYYLEEAVQEPEVQEQLEALKNPNLNPLDIKALDPCCGSGHILVYAFEVLYEIYKNYGYMEEDIAKSILENNLYGLDIDDRAAQLASFAVMMKARSKNRGVFRENIKLNICAIQESNWVGNEVREILVDREAMELEQNRQRELITYLAENFKDAKEYGSILDVRELDLEFLEQRLQELEHRAARDLLEVPYRNIILGELPRLILQAKIMGAKYDVVCTNPPYMGRRKSMNDKLSIYLDNNFQEGKMDLFSVFMLRNTAFCKRNGYMGFMTPFVWLYLNSYIELRNIIINSQYINNFIQLEESSFKDAAVSVCTFTIRNSNINNNGTFVRLSDFVGEDIQPVKVREAVINQSQKYVFNSSMSRFYNVPDQRFAYWINDNIINSFKENLMGKRIDIKQGITTSNNERFLRVWSEVDFLTIGFGMDKILAMDSGLKWFPYNKGGENRKWYGNNEYVINYQYDGKELREFHDILNRTNPGGRLKNREYYFLKSVTWSDICGNNFAARACREGFLFDVKGSCSFTGNSIYLYTVGLLNSKNIHMYVNILNPSVTTQVGDIKQIPFIMGNNSEHEYINIIVTENISISKNDWDSFETSWEFVKHPFLVHIRETIERSFDKWNELMEKEFRRLKANEEELNRIFIDIYGLKDELNPEVEDKDITVRKADRERDIKSFISYAVGCMLGRYSLDEEGLVFAGGKFDPERYKTFKADADGILPVLSDSYFNDDIVTQFVESVKVTFGENTLHSNLDYIAETLGRKVNESSRECIRRYFLKDFYKDHVQIYKKRPIYWLFTSGKEQGFNALVYMHRYDSNMVSRVRTDYLHPLQNKLEAQFLRLNQVLVSEDSLTEKTKATKRLKELTKQMDELKKYDEIIHNIADQQIEIDLDDGVVVNYSKFDKVLAKI